MLGECELEILNEEAVKEYDRRVAEGKIKKPNVRITFPLVVLMEKLHKGPLSLRALLNLFENNADLPDFLDIIREYLPEREIEIMSSSMDTRINKFCRYFSAQYFHLSNDRYEDDVHQFMRCMPIELQGITEDQYLSFDDMRPGWCLMLSLIQSPYGFSDDDYPSHRLGHMVITDKVPIMDKTGTLIQDMDLLAKIPKEGWSHDEIHQMVKDTPMWWGIADFADWVNHDTAYDLLNISDSWEEEGAIISIPWSKNTVKTMTIQWPEIMAFWDRIDETASWLEKDPHANYQEMVEEFLTWHYIDGTQKYERKKYVKQKTLWEVFDEQNEGKSEGKNNRIRPATRSDLIQIA